MKKKIFITGAVREYDSSKPEDFTNGIIEYIKTNLADEKSRDLIAVNVRETSPDQIVIVFPFSTDDDIEPGTISHMLYRCLFGECSNFVAKYTLGSVMYMGKYTKVNWREEIRSVKNAHKRNTKFYGADSYKRIDLVENKYGLVVRITF